MKIPSKAAGICIIVCYAVTTSETFTFICHFTSVWICARSRNIHFSSGMQGVRCSLVILETKVLCLLLLHCHAWFSYWLGFPTGSTYIPCYLFQSVVFYFFFFFSKPCDLWNPSNSRKIDWFCLEHQALSRACWRSMPLNPRRHSLRKQGKQALKFNTQKIKKFRANP